MFRRDKNANSFTQRLLQIPDHFMVLGEGCLKALFIPQERSDCRGQWRRTGPTEATVSRAMSVSKPSRDPNLIQLNMAVLCPIVSEALRPRGLRPVRLLCPWDAPGKNTGVGCHFLLQGIFSTLGSNLCLLHLMYWQAGS